MNHEIKNGRAKVVDLPKKQTDAAVKNELHASATLGRCVSEFRELRSGLAGILTAGPKHGSFHGVVSEMAGLCGELRDYLLVMRRMGA